MLVLRLNEVNTESWPLVGGKAAQLGALLGAGLPVPVGFCVTTAAFHQGMDSTLEREIAGAYEALGGGPVAVRSSATAEDLAEVSFAGQQDSFLNVSGLSAVLEAVRACWQSLHSERAIAYRREQGISEAGIAMAVVIQRMVEAEAAGVLFTLNPVTGAIDELVVEAALGLGDQVVSARVNPDRYRLRRRAPHELIGVEGEATSALLSAKRLAELARLGLAAERLLGRAADVEWALADGRFSLLQARAVTAADPRVPEVQFGSRWNAEHCRGKVIFWANHNVRETMPYPHTPFSWSFWKCLVLPQMAVGITLLDPEEIDKADEHPSFFDLVDGRIYWNLSVVAGVLPRWALLRLTQALDAELASHLGEWLQTGEFEPERGHRSGWRGRRLALRRFLRLLHRLLFDSDPKMAWQDLLDCQQEVANFRQIGLHILSDEQILAMAKYFIIENFPRMWGAISSFPGAVPAALFLSRALPKWGFAESVTGLASGMGSNPTVDTALALWDLAQSASPQARAVILDEPLPSVAETLAKSPGGRKFLKGMEEFLRVHGHRAVREFDFSCPRWRDDPTFLYETVRNYVSHPAGELTPREHYERRRREHEEAKADIERKLAWHPVRRRLFRWLVRVVEERLPLREAVKFYMLIGLAHVRDLYLEVARRMVARGTIDKPEDFFFLSIPEIEELTAGKLDAPWIQADIPKRRREFARQMRANPPLVMRSDGKPVLKPQPGGEVLRGTPVSWGTAKGAARILLDPGDGAHLRKGEILVAPFTDPGWTPLFLTAGGLVMEIGGVMSHGAVVAREYGIPAVVGVKDATRLLRDGELIEVDGATGEIRRKVTSDASSGH